MYDRQFICTTWSDDYLKDDDEGFSECFIFWEILAKMVYSNLKLNCKLIAV